MSRTPPGPKELALRAQREAKANAPKRLIPYAGKTTDGRSKPKKKGKAK